MAGARKLSNLCLILDYNRMQVGGHVDNVVGLEPVADKFQSFGFRVETIDGNDMEAVVGAFARARAHRSAHLHRRRHAGWQGRAQPRRHPGPQYEAAGGACRQGAERTRMSRAMSNTSSAADQTVSDFIARGATGPLPRHYGDALVTAARKDPRIVALCADLPGPTETDLFQAELPDRYFEAGIAEANMIGMAAGFARMGQIPSSIPSACSSRAAPTTRSPTRSPIRSCR